ncbi:unnamed protein product, partial [Polarella glacialis]
DADGDGWLSETEMRTFGYYSGFDGTDADWAEEFRNLCVDRGGNSGTGIGSDLFEQLLEDKSDKGCYCSDGAISSMLDALGQEPGPAPAEVSTRAERARAVFAACDDDRDDRLNSSEMLSFATLSGFEGSPDDWELEYRSLCEQHGADPYSGIGLELFLAMLDDRSASGCYCEDAELNIMLEGLSGAGRKSEVELPLERSELVNAVFDACDVDRDGLLDEREMRRFAELTGFAGGQEEWADEFQQLCLEQSVGALDLLLFAKLVEDESEGGCYCPTSDLAQIRRLLKPP